MNECLGPGEENFWLQPLPDSLNRITLVFIVKVLSASFKSASFNGPLSAWFITHQWPVLAFPGGPSDSLIKLIVVHYVTSLHSSSPYSL